MRGRNLAHGIVLMSVSSWYVSAATVPTASNPVAALKARSRRSLSGVWTNVSLGPTPPSAGHLRVVVIAWASVCPGCVPVGATTERRITR